MLCVTLGEPAGIGPDLVVRLAQQPREVPWLVIGDPQVLLDRAALLSLALSVDTHIESPAKQPGVITVLPVSLDNTVEPGKLDTANVPGMMSALDRAISGCLAGEFDGMVTAPMQKSIVNDAGIRFSGHTEYLCEGSDVDDVVMLLAADDFRVALATTHLPLAEVPGALTQDLLERRLQILYRDLQNRFSIPSPTILVCGLNPHAGEQGHLGREEIEVIYPVCARVADAGLNIVGPLPADTLFTPKHLDSADAVLAMYHDQGLPVLKYAGFGRAVNITLGLPFVRTSVDHGTALDIAGTADADSSSMQTAIATAARMAGIASISDGAS